MGLPALALLAAVAALAGALALTLRASRAALDASLQRARQSERLFSAMFFKSATPMVLVSFDTGAYVEVNDAYCALVGRSREDLIDHTMDELAIMERPGRERLLRRLARGGVVRELGVQFRLPGGATRDVLLSADLVEIDGLRYVLGNAIDETERKRTEAALHATDARLRELAATIDEVFFITSADGRELHYVSPAFERVWGTPCTSPTSWLEGVHPDDRAMIAAAEAAARPEREEREFRVVRPDGEVRWVRSKLFWVCDADGRVVRRAGVAADVTEQRLLEERLRQAQKMESIGLLAGGIAHDFNNVLAAISTCNSLLAETIPHGTSDREIVGDIEAAVGRGIQLARQLLAFSRKQVSAPALVDVNATVKDTRNMLSRLLGDDIEVTLSLDPELGRVRIDPDSLGQMILNLAVNARDAMSDGGTLALATRAIDIAPLGRAVCLSVHDTGRGMPESVRARVFEPFFTTKDRGKGTGLGLSVVYGIVEQAGGKIEVESRVGFGTTFHIYLPVAQAEPKAAEKPPAPARSDRGETILIVDDDDYVRRSAARSLRRAGYAVVEACDGEAALRVIAETMPDLMLTDVVMPGMDGRQLAERAMAKSPSLKVVFMSGYTEDEVVRRGVRASLIQKPFSLAALTQKVREVLDQDDARAA